VRLKTGLYIATFVIFFAIVAVFVGYLASVGLRLGPPAKRTALSLNVSDINSIVVDSNVLLRGVPVGKVTAIDVSPATATIHFYVASQYQVPVDSTVRLENLSALGETYIELEPRSSGGPVFRDGERITPNSNTQPPSISDLSTSLGRVLGQLDPGQLNRVVGEADTGLPDPNVVLPNLTRATTLLRNTTTDFKGQGRALLDNLQVLLQNTSWLGPALAKASPSIRDLGPAAQSAWNDTWMLAMWSRQLNTIEIGLLVGRIQKFLDDRAADLKVLGEATSENVTLMANGLKNLDSSEILANLLTTIPADGAIDLHVPIRER
jgi:phospholipid/cholesterol/gamma-HCH transport system substrate-binding protein